jgi:MFS family permease
MDFPITLTSREFLFYAVLIGSAVGALFGLAPLILGIRRGRRRLGLYGFVLSIVGGAIAPLISIVVSSVFLWLIVKASRTGRASNDDQAAV